MFKEIKLFLLSDMRKRLIIPLLKNITICILLSLLFYDNLLFLPLLAPVFVLLSYEDIKRIKEKENSLRLTEFQDLLMVLSQSLQAGASVENAFTTATEELSKIHGGKSVVMKSLYKIIYGLQMNIPIEKLILNMAEEIDIEEVHLFASVFTGGLKSGVNTIEVISFTSDSLMENIKTSREAEQIISAKKTEQNIMNLVPMGILLYIKLCSGDFIEALYHNLSGVLIMTVFLCIYLIAYLWSAKIMKLEG